MSKYLSKHYNQGVICVTLFFHLVELQLCTRLLSVTSCKNYTHRLLALSDGACAVRGTNTLLCKKINPTLTITNFFFLIC